MEIWAINTGANDERIVETQLLNDILLDVVRCGCGHGDDWYIRKLFLQACGRRHTADVEKQFSGRKILHRYYKIGRAHV